MALEAQGGRTQYLNMPEVEMADGMCGGHKQVSQMLRNIYDRQRAGALRATADGVTGNPILRANQSDAFGHALCRQKVLQERPVQRHLRAHGFLL